MLCLFVCLFVYKQSVILLWFSSKIISFCLFFFTCFNIEVNVSDSWLLLLLSCNCKCFPSKKCILSTIHTVLRILNLKQKVTAILLQYKKREKALVISIWKEKERERKKRAAQSESFGWIFSYFLEILNESIFFFFSISNLHSLHFAFLSIKMRHSRMLTMIGVCMWNDLHNHSSLNPITAQYNKSLYFLSSVLVFGVQF